VFAYLIVLMMEWKWLGLVMGYMGGAYKILLVFVLMVARNIRSLEQLKHVRRREAGIVLGLGRLPSKPTIWSWFYEAASKQVARLMLFDYVRYQLRAGLVGLSLWFTDGHHLPYTGKEKVRSGYNTQRRMPFPGQTNLVTCDSSGRIVDFEIQEGKGDLRGHISELSHKWEPELAGLPVMIFDREGYGAPFFSGLVQEKIPFITWEKHVDTVALTELDDALFTGKFSLNGKTYQYFEAEKSFTYTPDVPDAESHCFRLRRIYLWNTTSQRRTCGLAWSGEQSMSPEDCARAILSRWGASENTFKHLQARHPFHYHPGFTLVESERQDLANPVIKAKERGITKITRELNNLYKKLTNTPESLNKDGTPRKNSAKAQLQQTVSEKETQLEHLKQEKAALPERVDVSTLEDYRSFKRIDNAGKYLFDFVTMSVWNARKQLVDWLRPSFTQENELVDLWYAISACHGWVKVTPDEVIVRLEPLQQPKRRLAQEQLCRKLTSLGAQTPTGKWMVIAVGESPSSQ
jgi:hypothetical protein